MSQEVLWIFVAFIISFFIYLIFKSNKSGENQAENLEIIKTKDEMLKIQDKFHLEKMAYEQKISKLQQQIIEQKKEFEINLQKEIKDAQKRSSTSQRSILKGQMAEKFVPFMQGFDYNPEDCEFLGKPVDYVIFNNLSKCEDGEVGIEEVSIVLLEVKTGSAKLNKRQEILKKVIKKGQIHFSTVRVNEEELKLENEPLLSSSMKSITPETIVMAQSTTGILDSLEDDRIGEKWTVEEELRLIESFDKGLSIKDIAEIHKRKEGGIKRRLQRLGKIPH